MPDSLLTILKLVFLALIWLFFVRVLRAVWAELRPAPAVGTVNTPGRAATPAPSGRGPTAVRIVEPAEQRGKTFPLADELTVGRAAGCGVALEHDTTVSQLHARIFRRDGKVFVEDLGSTNGTYLNAKKITAPCAVSRGDRLQVGRTVLEVTR